MLDVPSPASSANRYRPLVPEDRDQGDPYIVAVPRRARTRFRYYVYTTGEDPVDGGAIPVYGSHDLVAWELQGEALRIGTEGAHWAPCVRYLPALALPYVMLYSRSVGLGEQAHVGHTIRRAHGKHPEGPFTDSGHVLTPDLDFAIDPDVYRLPDGSLKLAFATDFVEDEPYGTGIVEAGLSEDLTRLTSRPRLLARPQHPWQVYDPARVMPWKRIAGVDWATQTVRWHTMEAPVGGLVSPEGRRVYLYSGGCFGGFYAVGALVGEGGPRLRDVTTGETGFVVHPRPERGFYAPGHCSWLRAADGDRHDYLMFHARFGAPDAKRQMCLAILRWNAADLPFAEPAP